MELLYMYYLVFFIHTRLYNKIFTYMFLCYCNSILSHTDHAELIPAKYMSLGPICVS